MCFVEPRRRVALMALLMAGVTAAGCALNPAGRMEPRTVEIVVKHDLTQPDVVSLYIQTPRGDWTSMGRLASTETRMYTYDAEYAGQYRMVAVRPGASGFASFAPEGRYLATSDRFVIRGDTRRVFWNLRSDPVEVTAEEEEG